MKVINFRIIIIIILINNSFDNRFLIMEREKQSKQYQLLKKEINVLLKDFEKNKEWADIGGWLYRLQEVLNNKKYSEVPQDITLFKRLAQCLNPSLPAGVHTTALKIYYTILKNFSHRIKLLPLASIGLFPFFEHSNSQNKFQLIRIFSQFFVNDAQCLQMLTSLMNALLTGLNENNEELAKKIYNICDKISLNYGKMWVDGAVWINILKSPKVRLAGFKYFTKVFKDRDRQKNNKEEEKSKAQNIEEFYAKEEKEPQNQEEKSLLVNIILNKNKPDDHKTRFPNFSTLVVNTFCACLKLEEDNLIKRSALDLLTNNLKLINKHIFGKEEGIILVEALLKLLISKEYSLTNRVYKYLFDQPDSQGFYIIDEKNKDYELEILVSALNKLLSINSNLAFQNDQESILKNNQSIAGQFEKSSSVKMNEGVLTIIFQLVDNHPSIAHIILKSLSYEIIKYIRQFYINNSIFQKHIKTSIIEFYQNIIVKYKLIFIESIVQRITSCSNHSNKSTKIPAKEIHLINEIKDQSQLLEIIEVLNFYFLKLQKISNFNFISKKKDGMAEESNSLNAKKEESSKEELEQYLAIREMLIRKLIEYLSISNCSNERISLQALELCNRIHREYLRYNPNQSMHDISFRETQCIDQLIAQLSSSFILQRPMSIIEANGNWRALYARLITLHPLPTKEILLPHIFQSSLSIVCITLLLGVDKNYHDDSILLKDSYKRSFKKSTESENRIKKNRSLSMSENIHLTSKQEEDLFFAIFKLLNCHLFEAKAIEFIETYRVLFEETFDKLINVVDPSQWLIYWNKMNGGVAGGIIRMIQNVNSNNSYNKHLSNRWIQESENIVSKIIDPIYLLIQNYQLIEMIDQKAEGVIEPEDKLESQRKVQKLMQKSLITETDRLDVKIYSLLKSIFKTSKNNFSKFFFLQKEKYLVPLINYIFACLDNPNYDIKSKSLEMLTFILSQANQIEEKYDVISFSLGRSLHFLENIIIKKKQIAEIEAKKVEFKQVKSDPSDLARPNICEKMDNIEIQLLEYSSQVCACISSLITLKNFKRSDEMLKIFSQSQVYDIMIRGVTFSDVSYIKTMYLDFTKVLSEVVVKLDKSKNQILNFVNKILERLFFMLKNQDITKLQEFIKGRNESLNMSNKESFGKKVRKMSSYELNVDEKKQYSSEKYKQSSSYEQQLSAIDINLEEKYAEIIELWNNLKFYVQFSIKNQIKGLPIINLLSIILQSFPFSYLKYVQPIFYQTNTPLSPEQSQNQMKNIGLYENLQEEIKNITGLKKEVLEIFQILWKKWDNQIVNFLIEKGDPRILIHASVDPCEALQTILKSQKAKQMRSYYLSKNISLPKGTSHYNLLLLLKENQCMYFIYLYFLYCNLSILRSKKSTTNFFDIVIEMLENFKSTTHIQTKLWLLEIICLLSQRLFSNKDISIENNNKIRQQVQTITKEVLDDVVSSMIKSKNFTHRVEIKTGIFNIFSKEEKQTSLFDFIKIFPPTIFKMYESYKEKIRKSKSSIKEEQSKLKIVSEIFREQDYVMVDNPIDNFLFEKFSNRTEEDYICYLSFCAIKTLNRIGNCMLISIFERDVSKIGLIMKQIFTCLLPMSLNRSEENQYFNELIAEYLHTVLDNTFLRAEIIKNMRKQILEIYYENDFFKCTQKTLAHWKAIIDFCTEGYDLLSELLSKEGLFEGIFTKKAEATRLKIKSFERVCFVIYAGRIDKYETKLRTVLESLNEVMKQENPSPALLILILFCIRILFMRLSAVTLNKLFKSVWPSLITLLIQIFKKDKTIKNVNLLLAALKVIELIHSLELEEFNFHRWMFVFDYFGIKIDPMPSNEECSSTEIVSPFAFKPFLTNFLPNHKFKCQFIPTTEEALGKIKPTNQVLRRKIVVKASNVDSEEEMKNSAYILMQYMMDLNEKRVEVSKDDIENLIEEDFISLDDYIFQIK